MKIKLSVREILLIGDIVRTVKPDSVRLGNTVMLLGDWIAPLHEKYFFKFGGIMRDLEMIEGWLRQNPPTQGEVKSEAYLKKELAKKERNKQREDLLAKKVSIELDAKQSSDLVNLIAFSFQDRMWQGFDQVRSYGELYANLLKISNEIQCGQNK